MTLKQMALTAILGAGLAGCVYPYPGTTQPPNVVQSSGISATGQSIRGGALGAPPGVGNLSTTPVY